MATPKTTTTTKITSTDQLAALQRELRDQERALKTANTNATWEKKTKIRNKQLVIGSLRKATDAEIAKMTHCHGVVCTIKCETCGKARLINKQDAFQVRFCKEHKATAKKAKAKDRRDSQRLEGVSVGDLEKKIKEAKAQLAKISS